VEGVEDRVVAAVENVLPSLGGRPRPTSTFSFDMSPPDGSIGIQSWVFAETAGEAADAVVRTVVEAARAITGLDHPLWDVRIVPGSAVFARAEAQDEDVSGSRRRRGGWRNRRLR
jgi:hypothetical protein